MMVALIPNQLLKIFTLLLFFENSIYKCWINTIPTFSTLITLSVYHPQLPPNYMSSPFIIATCRPSHTYVSTSTVC